MVALQDSAASSSSTTSQQKPYKGMGKGRKGKGKGKGKSSTYRFDRPPAKQPDPKGRAKSALAPACMRCGSTSHKTAQCTQSGAPKPANTSTGKRQAVEGMAILSDETTLVMLEDAAGHERPDCAMIDPGASSFLMGSGPLIRYIQHLKQLGYDTSQLKLQRCQRTFHFGGDHQKVSTWAATVPVYLNGTHGLLQGFVLKGETPMLIGRPIIKALDMSIDFARQQLKFGDNDWQAAVLGRHEEYLLDLTATFETEQLAWEPSFDLQLDETLGEYGTFEEFLTEEHLYQVEEELPPEETSPMTAKHWKTLVMLTQAQLNTTNAFVDQTLKEEAAPRPRALWEVYTGRARLSKIAEAVGMTTKTFGFETGWNFALQSHQRAFLNLMDEEMPDEVFLSPSCGPWSRMQNISANSQPRQEILRGLREWHHRTHLQFCKKVYLKQLHSGRHGHIEQPTSALSWETSALQSLPGLRARHHQCQYGAVCMDVTGTWKPAKKDTTILTTKRAVAESMSRLCPGDHEHCRLEGHMKGHGTHRTSFMEDYQPAFAATLATALASSERPQTWEDSYVVREHTKYLGKIVDLHAEGKQNALRVIQKLHRNLGHPSAQALVDLLQARGASKDVLAVAENYLCSSCLRYKKPNQPAPATTNKAERFNQTIQADVFWVRTDKKKWPILAVLDCATKYQVACQIQSEQTQDYIQSLERHWIAHFGPPEELITDEGRGWLSNEFMNWSDEHSISHKVAPGEAHERLGQVERRHSVLRKAIEVYMHDLQLEGRDGIRQALTYILPQINAQPTVAGFSPTQWVLGYQPAQPGLLHSGSCALHGHEDFEKHLHQRNVAKTAILQAETDRKLRRALLRRYAGVNQRLLAGQRCFYWRDAQQHELCKIRWRGPAKVVCVEEKDGSPHVYWLAHKTQLIRAAPHHVRPDFTSIEDTAVENLKDATSTLQALKSRGVTRYVDLNKANKQDLFDVEEHEEELSLDEGPELKRRRLAHQPDEEQDMEEYTPSEPSEPQGVPSFSAPQIETDEPMPAALPPLPRPEDLPAVPGSPSALSRSDQPEPSIEPEPPTVPPTPVHLDPVTSEAYKTPTAPETFQQQRLRLDKQETLSFGPQRPRHHVEHTPYDKPAAESSEMVFEVQDLDSDSLPKGWTFNKNNHTLELKHKLADFWEITGGCLIRHHVRPRSKKFMPNDITDLPIPLENLDDVRVTVFREPGCDSSSTTDHFKTENVFSKNSKEMPKRLPAKWIGCTIFQINATTRKELGMTATMSSSSTSSLRPIRKAAQHVKTQQLRHMKKEKNKTEVREKALTQAEQQLFYEAKCKELRSFFECGVWEFTTSDKADAQRTLSSRVLLKWAKNPDGTPRAKARLVVRGYNDADALAGNLDTQSPTASRLARSLLLSISSMLKWHGWSADVATAFLQGMPQTRQLWLRLPNDCLEILGCGPETRMALIKPVYGQLDAPRRWWQEATRRLTKEGWIPHELDPCLFALHHTLEDGTTVPCGLIALHVDDMLGAGDRSCPTYVAAERRLKEVFEFRSWQEDSETMEYCGVLHDRKDFCWTLSQRHFIQKVKPVTIHRGRSPEDPMTEADRSQLRALLGSLQWPSVQSQPHLQASCSLISGQQRCGKLKAIMEANALLKFAKEHVDVSLKYEPFQSINSQADLMKLRLVIMFDASHAAREDHSSQGGHLAILVPEEAFQQETPYHVVDWRSYKLPRIARSSLSAEAQAAGGASDTAEYICRFWSIIFNPWQRLRDRLQEVSPLTPTLVTDAKALYDAWHKETATSASSSVDKRTYLEIKVAKQQTSELGGCLKWVSSERQFADGLTKGSTKGLLADRLRRHQIKLAWDPSYTSAKKKSKQEREESRQEFAEPKMKRKPTRKQPHQPEQSPNFTQQLESVHEEPYEMDEIEQLENPNENLDRPWPSSSNLKTPMAMLVYFTQIKAVTAGFSGVHTPLEPEEICLPSDGPTVEDWSILTYMSIFVLLTILIVSYLSYKFGRMVEKRRQVKDLDVKLRVAHGRNQRHFDAALDEQNLALDRRMSQLENDLVKAAEEHATTRSNHNEMIAQWQIEQQEAEEIDQAFQQCQAHLSRCFRELQDHINDECPIEMGCYVAPFGHTWHTTRECHGLKQAHRVDHRPCCHFCTPTPRTPFRVNSLSGTTLWEDMQSWRRQWGARSYEEWLVD